MVARLAHIPDATGHPALPPRGAVRTPRLLQGRQETAGGQRRWRARLLLPPVRGQASVLAVGGRGPDRVTRLGRRATVGRARTSQEPPGGGAGRQPAAPNRTIRKVCAKVCIAPARYFYAAEEAPRCGAPPTRKWPQRRGWQPALDARTMRQRARRRASVRWTVGNCRAGESRKAPCTR